MTAVMLILHLGTVLSLFCGLSGQIKGGQREMEVNKQVADASRSGGNMKRKTKVKAIKRTSKGSSIITNNLKRIRKEGRKDTKKT